MPDRKLLSHVDLRVRNRARAVAFYDAIFKELGATAQHGEDFTEYRFRSRDTGAGQPRVPEWFGFTQEAHANSGATRIALAAASEEEVDRVAAVLHSISAQKIEGPEHVYGYYAVFWEDPDGNRLECCYVTA
ncbi:MAG: VOC family protein [Candidatus Eremiobacteraeota bacterium]|nr:VOC family protein [Candidatus Eremiobacteraeota bacterium]MBC5826402.1 VOC family protein [Candidatus Eremiobacteraeota bacterium]